MILIFIFKQNDSNYNQLIKIHTNVYLCTLFALIYTTNPFYEVLLLITVKTSNSKFSLKSVNFNELVMD